MLAPAVLALALASDPALSEVEQKASFAHVKAFRVRADPHGEEAAEVLAALKADVEEHATAALRRRGVPLLRGPRPPSQLDLTADVVIDVHVATASGLTAVAWSFHVSQMVVLHTGGLAFASTWELGDLSNGPASTARERLRRSLQVALDAFCATYDEARSRYVPPDVEVGEPERGATDL